MSRLRDARRSQLRYGLSYSRMPITTLIKILNSHKHSGSWPVVFSWRNGPKDKVTIYDYELPRRRGMPTDERIGWSEDDWLIHSYVINCHPQILMARTPDGIQPGYLGVLITLLSDGCLIPSRCLDDWLATGIPLGIPLRHSNSRRLCPSWLRTYYRKDL